MPRYELMYILSSSVSDDQIPEVSGQILQFISDFGGTDINETQLGKKKLAYPIKKTRNGNYVVVNFNMDSGKINGLDAKLRTQTNTIIRYIIVNQDEHLIRLAKDREIQAKMNRNRPIESPVTTAPEGATETPENNNKENITTNNVNLDEEIEKALSEDLSK